MFTPSFACKGTDRAVWPTLQWFARLLDRTRQGYPTRFVQETTVPTLSYPQELTKYPQIRRRASNQWPNRG